MPFQRRALPELCNYADDLGHGCAPVETQTLEGHVFMCSKHVCFFFSFQTHRQTTHTLSSFSLDSLTLVCVLIDGGKTNKQ